MPATIIAHAPLYADIRIEAGRTGLHSATITAGPRSTTLYGYLSPTLARAAAEHAALAVFGRVARPQ